MSKIREYLKPIYCVELDKYFINASAAGRELYIDQSAINKAIKGHTKTCGGYHWQRVSVEEYNEKNK